MMCHHDTRASMLVKKENTFYLLVCIQRTHSAREHIQVREYILEEHVRNTF
jgi:hypothetical protein